MSMGSLDPRTDPPAAVQPDRALLLATLPNLRDLGGLPTRTGGRTVAGRLYRSMALDRVAGPDADVLEGLGVGLVIDLRTAAERSTYPDRLPAGARDLHLDVLADSANADPAQLEALFGNPGAADQALGGGRGRANMIAVYRDMVTLASAKDAYRQFFLALADPQPGATLFHCTTGKDRTGWAAAVTLLAVGVDWDTVMADYLQTNIQLQPVIGAVLGRYEQAGGDPEILRPIMTVDPDYLEAAAGQMKSEFGSLAGYLGRGLGLTGDQLQAVAEGLVG